MDIEQMIRLVNTVSASNLTEFSYEESGMTVRLEKKQGKTVIYQNMAPMEAAAPGISTASAKESVPKAGMAEESTQPQAEKNGAEGKVITSPLV